MHPIQNRKGAATLELAVLLPLLLVLCVTAIDFGRFAYVAIALDNAVRVGAEYGATRQFTDLTYSDWKASVLLSVQEEMASAPATATNGLSTSVTTEETASGLARVQVSGECPFYTAINWPFLPSPITIRRELSIQQFR